ncbi:MAG: hypothetical protein ACLP59_24375 [Bryobacteraceae bacterium]
MKNIMQARFLTFTLLAAGAAMPVLAQLSKPTIIEFNAPGAGTGAYQGTIAVGINAAGLITGYYFTSGGSVGAYGFVRTPDGNLQSFAPSGAYYTYPQSINPQGEIAGYSYDNAVASGFLRTPGGDLITIDLPGGGTGYGQGTFAWNINPAGEIAGTYTDGNGVSHGFLRAPDGTISTFDVPGAGTGANQGTYMASYEGLSATGVVAGWYLDANNVNHGYVRAADATITTFDAPGAGTGAYQGTLAYGINPAGEIPGVYYDENNVLHGFLRYPGGNFTPIDVPGAVGTNVQNISFVGAIDGDYYDTNGASHGFARTPGGAIVRFDAPGAGADNNQGTYVGANNVWGDVPGYYTDANNVYHGFLWKP